MEWINIDIGICPNCETLNRQWISVKERFPEIGQRVLVYDKNGVQGGWDIDIEKRVEGDFWSEGGIHSGITHWMPLPEAPKEE